MKNEIPLKKDEKHENHLKDSILFEKNIICPTGEKWEVENEVLDETVYLLDNAANAKHLLKSINELESGKGNERELID